MTERFHLGTWSHRVSDFGESPDAVEGHVARLADAGFELIIPCVKNPPGYADFRTDVATVNPEYPDWDPLRVLCEAAEARGLKVHAWFCVFAEGEQSALLSKKPHLAAVHQEQSSRVGWACACHPEVQEYEMALYKSVAAGYPIHGLHLDYIRTGGVCQCEACKQQMAKQGIDVAVVARRDPAFAEWVDWRCGRITDFVRALKAFTQSKGLELSAAVFADLPSCRVSNGQDWAAWAEAGLVDLLIPMNYDNAVRNVRLRTASHLAQVGNCVAVWEGLGKRSSMSQLSTEALVAQVKAVRTLGAQGVVTFNYPALSDEDLAALRAV